MHKKTQSKLRKLVERIIREEYLLEEKNWDVKVVWSDRDYKSHEKLFINDPNGPPENALNKARKFKKSLEDKDEKSSYGLFRSIRIDFNNK